MPGDAEPRSPGGTYAGVKGDTKPGAEAGAGAGARPPILLASAASGIAFPQDSSVGAAAPSREAPTSVPPPASVRAQWSVPAPVSVRAPESVSWTAPDTTVAQAPRPVPTESVPAPRAASMGGYAAPTAQIVAKVEPTPTPEPPAVSVAIGAPPAAPPVPPANAEIEALFATFVDSYERGRTDAFAALFADDADTNLRRGRAAIRGEYDELFRLSQWRRMQLTRITWRPVGDRAVANGEITVKIGWRDGREVEQRLNVNMELARRDGRVVIARLMHQPKNP